MNLFSGNSHFGMKPRTSGTKRRNINLAARATEASDGARTDVVEFDSSVPQDKQPGWTARGLFKSGFSIGSPRIRGGRLYTKGRAR
jgi:hypothetical protein